MKKQIFLLISLFISTISFVVGQENWNYVNKENISFKIPQGWSVISSAKPKGPITLRAKDKKGTSLVEIRCVREKINLKNRATDIATLRSHRPTFEYMQIDNISSTTLGKYEGLLLKYTNTYLNDVSKGGVYCFTNEGYTYTAEFFSPDNPTDRKTIEKILLTLNVNSTEDKIENIAAKEPKFVPKGWKEEEVDKDALRAEQEAQKAKLKAEKELQKAQIKAEKQMAEDSIRHLKDSLRLVEQLKKDSIKLYNLEQKALKQAQKDSINNIKAQIKAEKQLRKERNIDGLNKRLLRIDKDLTAIANDQLDLSVQYGKAQQKQDKKKMDKIKSKQETLLQKVDALNSEKQDIESTLKSFE